MEGVLVGVLAADGKELLQSHDLVVKLDLGLGKHTITHLRVLSVLGQLTNLLGDRSDFSTIVMVNEKTFFVLSSVLVLLLVLTNESNGLTVGIDVVKDVLLFAASLPTTLVSRADEVDILSPLSDLFEPRA